MCLCELLVKIERVDSGEVSVEEVGMKIFAMEWYAFAG